MQKKRKPSSELYNPNLAPIRRSTTSVLSCLPESLLFNMFSYLARQELAHVSLTNRAYCKSVETYELCMIAKTQLGAAFLKEKNLFENNEDFYNLLINNCGAPLGLEIVEYDHDDYESLSADCLSVEKTQESNPDPEGFSPSRWLSFLFSLFPTQTTTTDIQSRFVAEIVFEFKCIISKNSLYF